MPRAFTEVEKEKIRERLFAAGRSCFTRYGLKKTTIDDLVKAVGIAKSSYYLFFESKESLYVELMMAEMPAMMERLIDVSFAATDDTREALVLLIKRIVTEIETNEFARIMLDNPSELKQLAASIDFDDILQRSVAFYAPLIEKIVEAQEHGGIVPGDPQQIMYSLGLIKLIPLNRDRLPDTLYQEMLDFIPQVLADGLTCPTRQHKEDG
ncbi:TetR/AcrR family transcriptional regulator [Candidatus Bipolaricaulota bacterium]|nr:TetR/AcrR family transcriptional regulator [Candidatus Bipolaricaulota bacterium]